MKIIVIGSAAAGVSAALRLSAGEKGAQTTVYEAGAFHSCGAGDRKSTRLNSSHIH